MLAILTPFAKYIFALIVIIFVLSGLYFAYNSLENKISSLKQANTQLIISNKALTQDMADIRIQQTEINNEVQKATEANNSILNKVQQLSNWNTPKKQAQVERIRKVKPELLINNINRNNECIRQHFSEAGNCVAGVWHSQ